MGMGGWETKQNTCTLRRLLRCGGQDKSLAMHMLRLLQDYHKSAVHLRTNSTTFDWFVKLCLNSYLRQFSSENVHLMT